METNTTNSEHASADTEENPASAAPAEVLTTQETTASPTPDSRFLRDAHRHIIDWDKHTLLLQGDGSLLVGADFDMWRFPDASQWLALLQDLRSLGFNLVRVNVCWGNHCSQDLSTRPDFSSPSRDLSQLLLLCEQVGLRVIAAVGPHIGRSANMGGLPLCIANSQNRHMHARHVTWRGHKKFCQRYANASAEWIRAVCCQVSAHQLSTQGSGCVIAVQLESSLRQRSATGIRLALDSELQLLASEARASGIFVPFLHNDPGLHGSWLGGRTDSYGVDLYGFDLLAPAHTPPPVHLIAQKCATLETQVRGLSGGASTSPIFITCLPCGALSGWNQDQTSDSTFENIREEESRTAFLQCVCAGASIVILTDVLGGSNSRFPGSSLTITSFDNSSCVREFGLVTNRARILRTAILQVLGFNTAITRSSVVKPTHPEQALVSSVSNVGEIVRQRISSRARISLVWNPSLKDDVDSLVQIRMPAIRTPASLKLRPLGAQLLVGDYVACNGQSNVEVVFSTLDWIVKHRTSPRSELWVMAYNSDLPTLQDAKTEKIRTMWSPWSIVRARQQSEKSAANHHLIKRYMQCVWLRGDIDSIDGHQVVVEYSETDKLTRVRFAFGESSQASDIGFAVMEHKGTSIQLLCLPRSLAISLVVGEAQATTLTHNGEVSHLPLLAWGMYHARMFGPKPTIQTWGTQTIHSLLWGSLSPTLSARRPMSQPPAISPMQRVEVEGSVLPPYLFTATVGTPVQNIQLSGTVYPAISPAVSATATTGDARNENLSTATNSDDRDTTVLGFSACVDFAHLSWQPLSMRNLSRVTGPLSFVPVRRCTLPSQLSLHRCVFRLDNTSEMTACAKGLQVTLDVRHVAMAWFNGVCVGGVGAATGSSTSVADAVTLTCQLNDYVVEGANELAVLVASLGADSSFQHPQDRHGILSWTVSLNWIAQRMHWDEASPATLPQLADANTTINVNEDHTVTPNPNATSGPNLSTTTSLTTTTGISTTTVTADLFDLSKFSLPHACTFPKPLARVVGNTTHLRAIGCQASQPGDALWRAEFQHIPANGIVVHSIAFSPSFSLLAESNQVASVSDRTCTCDPTEVNIRIPLRLHIRGAHAMSIWLNGSPVGKYNGLIGLQHDFFVLDDLVKWGQENVLSMVVYGWQETFASVSLMPYFVNPTTGCIDDTEGKLFYVESFDVRLKAQDEANQDQDQDQDRS